MKNKYKTLRNYLRSIAVVASFQAIAQPLGEFKVNTYTTNSQFQSAVASNSSGNMFVVCWTDYTQDGSESGVYAQMYSNFVATGSEILVNTTTGSDQWQPSIAMNATGEFVITWTSTGQDNGNSYGIYAQRFSSSGVKQGSEFLVNTTTTGNQEYSSVAIDASGNFVVTWTSSGQDGDGNGVYAQRFNSSGVAQGSEFLVNTITTNNQQKSVVAMDSDGDFVIAWESVTLSEEPINTRTTAGDEDGAAIYAKVYDETGAVVASDFQVNVYWGGDQKDASIGMDAAGNFVIGFTSTDLNGTAAYARRFNAAGTALASEFRANTSTTLNQENTAVAVAANGDFIITWDSENDASGTGVYGQQYYADGTKAGTEFRANVTETNAQQFPAVACNVNGDFIIVWESDTQDGSALGVYGQVFLNLYTPISKPSSRAEFILYPNPTKSKLSIDSYSLRGVSTLSILSSSGHTLLEKQIAFPGNNTIDLDLKPGFYFVKIENESSHSMQKIVVE